MSSLISITKLYDLLAAKLGRETAGHLATYIEDKYHQHFAERSNTLVTKEDLGTVKDNLAKEISRLDIKIGETKSELIKWMFVFWIAQVASIFGFIFLFIKK